MAAGLLSKIDHIVVLMLENRSFDHMLGFLYEDSDNVSPLGHPFEGLTGNESNPGSDGKPVKVFKITSDHESPYFMPGADPGEGYPATNSQLYGQTTQPNPLPAPAACNPGVRHRLRVHAGVGVEEAQLEDRGRHH